MNAPVRVWHYDGMSALKRQAELAIEGDQFRLIEGERVTGPFAFAELVSRDPVAGNAVFGRKRQPGWRMGFDGDPPPALAGHLPKHARYGRLIDRFGLWPSVAVSAVIAALVVIVFLHTPAFVARAVPRSVERQLGDLMAGDFSEQACDRAAGNAALDRLAARVAPNDLDVRVSVVNLPIVNAVTLPGGRILLFDGLLREARSADEVAGVLAHEIGHVRHRDVMESLLRQVGLSVLLGGLDGRVGGYTNALLASAYSRDAEAKADGYAIEALKAARISPLPLARFFQRLSRAEPGSAGALRLTSYLSTHPAARDRATRMVASARTHAGGYTPVIDDTDWAALRTICPASSGRLPRFRF